MAEYLSVADFAVAASVTKQAVYRRMDTNLKEYVRVENGKKFVSTDAIPLFHVEPTLNNVEQRFEQSEEQRSNNVEQAVDPRDSEIDRLLSLLEASQAENRALNERLMTLSLEIAAMGKSAQVIAVQTSGVLMLNNVDQPMNNDEQRPVEIVESVEQSVEKEKTNRLPGWLKWLISRYEA